MSTPIYSDKDADPAIVQEKRLAFIGAGKRSESGGEMIRKLAAAGALGARQRHVARAAFVVRGNGVLPELAQAAAEGLTAIVTMLIRMQLLLMAFKLCLLLKQQHGGM